jgi:hypothetical protein
MEAAKAAGIGPDIEHKGRRYRLKDRTPEFIGLMEVWLQGRAWDALERMRGVWPPHIFAERSDRLLAQIAAGVYSWGSMAMADALRLRDGLKETLYLAMVAEDRNVTRELVEEIVNDREEKALEAMRKLNEPDPTMVPAADPNSA